jgi:chromosome segregation ATPase
MRNPSLNPRHCIDLMSKAEIKKSKTPVRRSTNATVGKIFRPAVQTGTLQANIDRIDSTLEYVNSDLSEKLDQIKAVIDLKLTDLTTGFNTHLQTEKLQQKILKLTQQLNDTTQKVQALNTQLEDERQIYASNREDMRVQYTELRKVYEARNQEMQQQIKQEAAKNATQFEYLKKAISVISTDITHIKRHVTDGVSSSDASDTVASHETHATRHKRRKTDQSLWQTIPSTPGTGELLKPPRITFLNKATKK